MKGRERRAKGAEGRGNRRVREGRVKGDGREGKGREAKGKREGMLGKEREEMVSENEEEKEKIRKENEGNLREVLEHMNMPCYIGRDSWNCTSDFPTQYLRQSHSTIPVQKQHPDIQLLNFALSEAAAIATNLDPWHHQASRQSQVIFDFHFVLTLNQLLYAHLYAYFLIAKMAMTTSLGDSLLPKLILTMMGSKISMKWLASMAH